MGRTSSGAFTRNADLGFGKSRSPVTSMQRHLEPFKEVASELAEEPGSS